MALKFLVTSGAVSEGSSCFVPAQGASLKEVVTLMHALQSLSFPEPAVLLQLTEAFLSQLDDGAKASLVSACLTSVGQVAWRHPGDCLHLSRHICTHTHTSATVGFPGKLVEIQQDSLIV